MQIVIDIPEVFYETLKKTDEIVSGQRSGKTLMSVVYSAIANGAPLPKGHGRLIDASQLLTVTECKEDGTEQCYIPYTHIEDAPTIIEADK